METVMLISESVQYAIFQIIAALVTTAATVATAVEARKAGKAQSAAIEREQRISDIQASRQRFAAVRSARKQRAFIRQSAENTGGAGSSGLAGSLGSLAAGTASEIGTNLEIASLSQEASSFLQKSADAQSRGAVYGAIGAATAPFADFGFLNGKKKKKKEQGS